MTTSRRTYEKDKQIVHTHDKFIYCSSVYQIWSWGAALMEEKYYSSNKPIVLKRINYVVRGRSTLCIDSLNYNLLPKNI